MADLQPQFDFLEAYIHDLFTESGCGEMSEETKNKFLPQFVAEAQRRLGLAVLPLLSEESAEEFVSLMEQEDMSHEELKNFWHRSVPQFDEVVQQTLQNFSKEFTQVFQNMS